MAACGGKAMSTDLLVLALDTFSAGYHVTMAQWLGEEDAVTAEGHIAGTGLRYVSGACIPTGRDDPKYLNVFDCWSCIEDLVRGTAGHYRSLLVMGPSCPITPAVTHVTCVARLSASDRVLLDTALDAVEREMLRLVQPGGHA